MAIPRIARECRSSNLTLNKEFHAPYPATRFPNAAYSLTPLKTPPDTPSTISPVGHSGNKRAGNTYSQGFPVSLDEESVRSIQWLHFYIREREKAMFHAHQQLQNLNCMERMRIQALEQAAKENANNHHETTKIFKAELKEKDAALKAKAEKILALKAAFESQGRGLREALQTAKKMNERQRQELETGQTQYATLQSAFNEAGTMNGRQQQELQAAENQSQTFQATLSDANAAKESAERALLAASEHIKTLQEKFDNACATKERQIRQLVTERDTQFKELQSKAEKSEGAFHDTKTRLDLQLQSMEHTKLQLRQSNDKLETTEKKCMEVQSHLQQLNESFQKRETEVEETRMQLKGSDEKLRELQKLFKDIDQLTIYGKKKGSQGPEAELKRAGDFEATSLQRENKRQKRDSKAIQDTPSGRYPRRDRSKPIKHGYPR